MAKKKLKIAITGNIGSGKTEFARFLKIKNYVVINADDLSKSILENDPLVRKEVVKLFGKESFRNGKPDRKYIADMVFNDAHKLNQLERILHPVVIKKTSELMESALKKNDIVFAEAALIYEADMEKYFDYIILIVADKKLRFKRKVKSENFSKEEFEKRDSLQLDQDEKRKRADFIFENNSDLEQLKRKVDLFFILIKHPDL